MHSLATLVEQQRPGLNHIHLSAALVQLRNMYRDLEREWHAGAGAPGARGGGERERREGGRAELDREGHEEAVRPFRALAERLCEVGGPVGLGQLGSVRVS